MRRHLYVGAAIAALVAPVCASAQETTGSISGTVTASGAGVPNATITVTNPQTGTRSTTTSDASGGFTVTGLRAGGPYTVTVESAQGGTEVTDIFTVAAQTFNLPLEVGAQDQGIIVTASSIQGAGSVSQGPATVLGAREIANIATVNRDIRDLSRRDPFARLDDSPTGGRSVSFAGQNARFNRFSVDGVAITDNFGLNTDGLPSRRSPIPLDAIGQFQAKVAPFDVREGNFQGGAINIVLKSGTNDFHGTGFYAYSGDEFVGDETRPGPGIPTGKTSIPDFKIENYGAEISGPIIKDKLFFMVAGERLRGGRPIPEGPTDNNSGSSVPNLRQEQVDRITDIADQVYGYNTGGVLRDVGDKDDRLVARIDANLSDTQRLSLTYTYAEDAINLLNNTFTNIATGSPGLGLASNAYIQGNRLHTGVFQLNTDHTDNFSTEIRGFYKNYKRIQDPVLGRGFAQFRVCTNEMSMGSLTGCEASVAGQAGTDAVVSFGPDNSRQTNELTSETVGGLFQGRLTMNDHDLRVFAELQDVQIFNSFLQNSAGNYYFDSIADFAAGRANSLTYGNAIPSLVPEDAAASFGYQSYTFGIMDTWSVTPTLNVSYGVRYDLFDAQERPAFSGSFTSRYQNGVIVNGERQVIGSNTKNLKGLDLFQPRLGFDWKPIDHLTIRGGGGVFGGGAPDVYVSNSFSNTGVLTNSLSISRTATGFSGFPTGTATATQTAVGNAALNGVTGTSVPGAVGNFLSGTTAAPTSTTNVLDPDFKIPSQWRATLTAEYDTDFGKFGRWVFGVDGFYSDVRNQVYFTDIRSQPLTGANALTPDGRQRYGDFASGTGLALTSTNTNQDILLTNTDKGRALIGVARFDASWDFGLSIYGSYTYQDVKDQAPATSSTAGSNYSNGAFNDPNNVEYGISNDEVRHNLKYGVTFDHAFFGDYKSTVALFGETRIGRPYSYTFQDYSFSSASALSNSRSLVFGTVGRSSATSTAGNRYLLYVPTVNDPRVSYINSEYETAFNNFIDRSGLGKYRGKVAPRNAFNSDWFTRLDLHLSQEIPTGLGGSRITLFGDIENFTNLINKKWGQIREYVFPYNIAVTQVQCLNTAVPTGTVLDPGAAAVGTTPARPADPRFTTNVSQPCAQYRYTPVNNGASFSDPVDQVYVNQSLYSIRIGARFTF